MKTTDKKKREVLSDKTQREQIDNESKPQSDLYGKVERTEKDTNVEIPTEESVEDLRDFSEINRR
ncbi:MAG: hypothetical protein Q4P29_03480 [Tissierellia bacterium]|nr:hypothetical protein [Tissierellia bacterium]